MGTIPHGNAAQQRVPSPKGLRIFSMGIIPHGNAAQQRVPSPKGLRIFSMGIIPHGNAAQQRVPSPKGLRISAWGPFPMATPPNNESIARRACVSQHGDHSPCYTTITIFPYSLKGLRNSPSTGGPMPQSLDRLYAHIVFSTKDRFPFLNTPDIRNEMHAYLCGVLKTLDSHPIFAGGVSDHVHILGRISKNWAIAKIVGEIKRVSSIWIKCKGGMLTKFHWQNGYGAFSIGRSEIDRVRTYIEQQEAHHATRTFQEEYRAFLQEYEIEFDERYVWD
jgi:putative transposase